MPKLYMTIGPI